MAPRTSQITKNNRKAIQRHAYEYGLLPPGSSLEGLRLVFKDPKTLMDFLFDYAGRQVEVGPATTRNKIEQLSGNPRLELLLS